jgi:hypothetical protein
MNYEDGNRLRILPDGEFLERKDGPSASITKGNFPTI